MSGLKGRDRRELSPWRKAAESKRCTECGAAPGIPCKTAKTRQDTKPHAVRMRIGAAQRIREAL